MSGACSYWQWQQRFRSVSPPALWRIEAEHGRVAGVGSRATETALALSRLLSCSHPLVDLSISDHELRSIRSAECGLARENAEISSVT